MSDSRFLPRPVTTSELYLAAILDEIRGLRSDGSPVVATAPGPIELREPVVELEPVGTPIPDGFPGLDALTKAGIETIEQIPRDGDSLVEIKGIGKATAGQILAELS